MALQTAITPACVHCLWWTLVYNRKNQDRDFDPARTTNRSNGTWAYSSHTLYSHQSPVSAACQWYRCGHSTVTSLSPHCTWQRARKTNRRYIRLIKKCIFTLRPMSDTQQNWATLLRNTWY